MNKNHTQEVQYLNKLLYVLEPKKYNEDAVSTVLDIILRNNFETARNLVFYCFEYWNNKTYNDIRKILYILDIKGVVKNNDCIIIKNPDTDIPEFLKKISYIYNRYNRKYNFREYIEETINLYSDEEKISGINNNNPQYKSEYYKILE